MQSQLLNCQLREETQNLQRQVIELQKSLEDLELQESELTLSAPVTGKKTTVDSLRSALRKHATLYDPFPPKDLAFYQKSRPEDSRVLTDYNERYKNDESESLANLAEFYVTLPHDHILQLSEGDLSLVRQVCVPHHIIFFITDYQSLDCRRSQKNPMLDVESSTRSRSRNI